MRTKRDGFTLTETFVAGLILATAFAVATQLVIAASRQRKALDLRQLALIEAGNVMERVAAEPWSKLDAEELGSWELGAQAAGALPNARLDIQIDPAAGQPDGGEANAKQPTGKRITVIVSYGGDGQRPARKVRLVAWRCEHAPLNIGSANNSEEEQ